MSELRFAVRVQCQLERLCVLAASLGLSVRFRKVRHERRTSRRGGARTSTRSRSPATAQTPARTRYSAPAAPLKRAHASAAPPSRSSRLSSAFPASSPRRWPTRGTASTSQRTAPAWVRPFSLTLSVCTLLMRRSLQSVENSTPPSSPISRPSDARRARPALPTTATRSVSRGGNRSSSCASASCPLPPHLPFFRPFADVEGPTS